jgi:hypothetical protein
MSHIFTNAEYADVLSSHELQIALIKTSGNRLSRLAWSDL